LLGATEANLLMHAWLELKGSRDPGSFRRSYPASRFSPDGIIVVDSDGAVYRIECRRVEGQIGRKGRGEPCESK
jgi:hypothetical protein